MSLLGIDVGTTACKVAAFSTSGQMLAFASLEYEVRTGERGRAELDAVEVYRGIKEAIRQVVAGCGSDPVTALAVSSMGEAMAPVSDGREILGPSILNFDERGQEFLPGLRQVLPDEELYRINGNRLGNHYGLTKLLWVKEHERKLYARAAHWLLWGSLVPFMLGAEPVVDFSLANRMLLFDLEAADWSPDLIGRVGLDRDKLARPVPAGTRIGTISPQIARELGLGPRVAIVAGAHDQCANALGCGVIEPGTAVYGMGTFVCITPVFERRRDPYLMIERGLNTEHHAVPGRFVSFIYNQGGSAVHWFRDTFAAEEARAARTEGRDGYDALFAEMPEGPSPVIALSDFAGGKGAFEGLTLATTRGEILKAIVEGTTLDLKCRV
ncbi:MAG: FGGY-family carbohydrate kinase, partial [Rudaea sp.]